MSCLDRLGNKEIFTDNGEVQETPSTHRSMSAVRRKITLAVVALMASVTPACTSYDPEGDIDGDGIANKYDPDRDGDGITNKKEEFYNCDPDKKDTDDDGLNDDGEAALGYRCDDPDTNDDGIKDGPEVDEFIEGFFPDPTGNIGEGDYDKDTDGDGIPDIADPDWKPPVDEPAPSHEKKYPRPHCNKPGQEMMPGPCDALDDKNGEA